MVSIFLGAYQTPESLNRSAMTSLQKMNSRTRFLLAVVILGLLMTGPFVITALLIWASAQAAEQALLIQLIMPHLSLGAMMTTFGFVVGLLVIHRLFRQYVQGLLKMAENLRLMLSANRNFRVDAGRAAGSPVAGAGDRMTWRNSAMV
jgi:DNA polymerase-3 subunit epsilon